MTFVAAALAIAIFAVCMSLLRILPTTRRAAAEAARALRVMRAETSDERAKEREVQRAALKLFGLFLSTGARTAIALAASLLSILLLDATGLVAAPDVYAALASWPAIVGAIVVFGALHWLLRR